jgi:hypothetical protein
VVKHGLKLVILVVAAANSAAAMSSPALNPKSEAYKFQVWRDEAVRALAARPDANSVATAAALAFTSSYAAPSAAPAALQLIARASELAPDSGAIGWLHLQLCTATPGCDSRDVATVLRWVDPDNGAAWLSQLTIAHRDRDTVEIDRVLSDMARGSRFDLYYNQLMVLMFDALSAVRRELPSGVVSSDMAKLATLSGVATAEIIPVLSPLIDSCRESTPSSARHDDCLRLAKIMQRGDTVVVQLVGFSIERRLVAPDSKEAKSLAERRRLLEWRSGAVGKWELSILPWTQNARARTRLAEMRLRPREEDVCIALLRDHHLALEPAEIHR